MTRSVLCVALLSLAVTATQAFTFSTSAPCPAGLSNLRSSTARYALLSEEETNMMFEKATSCAEGECAIDDVSELIRDLEEQKKAIYARLVEITSMVDALKKINESGDRPVDEVRETVRAIARLFLMGEGTGTMPMGWTGDTKGGGKTAFDVLPPKKWTPPKDS